MSKSLIEWCDHTAKVVDGCDPVSPGCAHCWASQQCGTRFKAIKASVGVHPAQHVSLLGTTATVGTRGDLVKPVRRADGGTHYAYNGRVALNADRLAKALKIPKNGGRVGRRVFWNSDSDTFHERLSFEEIAAQFAVMGARDDLQFMVLTKRPENAQSFFWELEDRARQDAYDVDSRWSLCPEALMIRSLIVLDGAFNAVTGSIGWRGLYEEGCKAAWPLPNVAIGVSAEDQHRWDERVPILRKLPKAYGFVSAEPLLGAIDAANLDGVDQVIIGAESGPGARPCKLKWIQDLGRQVLDAGVNLFVKQADVCSRCAGDIREYVDDDGHDLMSCIDCCGSGLQGKLRKHCPEVWIPGHGTQQWDQHFWQAKAS